MTLKEKLADYMQDDTIIFADYDYEDACIGISEDGRAVYDYDKMILWLTKTKGYTEDEAVEWIEFNTIRALPYMGDMRPIILHRFED